MPTPTVPKIQTRFKQFEKGINEVWECYNLVQFYNKDLHTGIKNDEFKLMNMKTIGGGTAQCTKATVTNALANWKEKTGGRTTLISACAFFEDYMTDLLCETLIDHPWMLKNTTHTDTLDIILDCSDKHEMMEKLATQKVCAAFHGHWSDFFVNDTFQIFGDGFATKFKTDIAALDEICTRRTACLHNNAKMDKRFVKTDTAYLCNAITTMTKIADVVTTLITDKVYKVGAKGKLARKTTGGKAIESHTH